MKTRLATFAAVQHAGKMWRDAQPFRADHIRCDACTPRKWWHDHAAERMRVLMMWPQRCNYQPAADVLAAVKRLNGGEPLWVSQARVLRAMTMTGHAIARGHQR